MDGDKSFELQHVECRQINPRKGSEAWRKVPGGEKGEDGGGASASVMK